ncbi:Hypothetical predicted protein [Cloeon dipterum]|uniref:C2H2-type domain-containing protein n=1 Tax=Cloeon dipterum TaxID=197152 RepID=A0A8S1DPA6_9INSE|nr:Hypothetical predicted protein [Cloeon dipterum]
MNCQDWKKSAQFRAKIAQITFGRASPPDTIIGFLHRKKICKFCEPPQNIPLSETMHDHIKNVHESISLINCHNCCERESDHFWIPIVNEDVRKVIQREQLNDVCPSYTPEGTTSLRFVLTNCEFCDTLVFISNTVEISNQNEFDGKPIWICTGCAHNTKLTVENMADVFNCREWKMSEKLRCFIHSLRIDYDLDGVNPGDVLGFVYKRRKCNICQMHLTMHETLDHHFHTHHSSAEKSTHVVCSKGC